MDFSDFNGTFHVMDEIHGERRRRLEEIGGCGETICGVLWDKGHERGVEVHVLTTNAIIFVFNYLSGNLVTFKFARPGQIRQLHGRKDIVNNRVFDSNKVEKSVMDKAKFYKDNGWNNI